MKVAITGPESSGKTTLAKALAQYYNCTYIEEFARSYLEGLGRTYTSQDLDYITISQSTNEKQPEVNNLIICDTDILTLKIWTMEKFGVISEVIQTAEEEATYDLILLMKPDFPWVYDPLREHAYERDRLFDIYLKSYRDKGSTFLILGGNLENRLQNAVKEIDLRLLSTE